MYLSNYKKRKLLGLLLKRSFRFDNKNKSPRSRKTLRYLTGVTLLFVGIVGLIYEQFLINYIKRTYNLRDMTNCQDVPKERRYELRGKYVIFYNFVVGSKDFKCHDSVTYATYSEVGKLKYLEAIVAKYDGPVSVAVYAPGSDFFAALETITFIRNCGHVKIKELVTFHLFFDSQYTSEKEFDGTQFSQAYSDISDCISRLRQSKIKHQNYRVDRSLPYPVNVARNIAKKYAPTHFVLSVDSSLLPSKDFPKLFINMIEKKAEYLYKHRPAIFVLPAFEIREDLRPPETKKELQEMIDGKTANLYQKTECPGCHQVPMFDWWVKDILSEYLLVFSVERKKPFWQPFYVGSKDDPAFDERIMLDDYSYILSDVYHLCLLNYFFLVLDNAFLVHNPAIRERHAQHRSQKDEILRTFDLVFGRRPYCSVQ